MEQRFTRFDPAIHLHSDDAVQIFLAEAFDTGDAAFIADVLALVVRCRGMDTIAGEAGLTRAELDTALAAGEHISLALVLKILAVLRVSIGIK
jgi:probable addiction module antidote protein